MLMERTNKKWSQAYVMPIAGKLNDMYMQPSSYVATGTEAEQIVIALLERSDLKKKGGEQRTHLVHVASGAAGSPRERPLSHSEHPADDGDG